MFLVRVLFIVIAVVASAASENVCTNKKTTSKLICYYSQIKDAKNSCKCTHVILPANTDVKDINSVIEKLNGPKILLTVNEFSENLISTLNSTKIDGLDVNLKKLHDKNDVTEFISTIKSKIALNLDIAVSIPSKAELIAKYYNLKALSKYADLFILQTAFLGASQNVTFHPSRLSGMWDMQNTDSVVDLVSGMGVPLSKLAITAPVQAFQFVLQNETLTAPGSPALEVRSLTREQLCAQMTKANWTLERDEDQAGPYIYRNNTWIAFEDSTSIDVKSKYVRVRGLAGLALKDLSQDEVGKCGSSLLETVYDSFSKQSRAPRGAILHSLEREILESPYRPLDTLQLSPYRISRIIDVEGNIHSIRQDTRTEFECARQGFFVHPRSCGRFYRCVKFDQLSDEFSVFEFDCPDGLVFDSTTEVCVWPGTLPDSSPCSGSSEIAPVPRNRFVCSANEGYFADPENCRWFFACLDHGKSPLSAYEFRCPFGLAFDEDRLVCEWPWLVPKCAGIGAYNVETTYHGGATLNAYDGLGPLGITPLGGLQTTLLHPHGIGYEGLNLGLSGNEFLGQSLNNNFESSGLLNQGIQLSQTNIQDGGFQSLVPTNVQYGGLVNNEALLDQSNYNPSIDLAGAINIAGLNQAHGFTAQNTKVQTNINDVLQNQGNSVTIAPLLKSHENINIEDIVQGSNVPIFPPRFAPAVASAPVTVLRSDTSANTGIVGNVPQLQYTLINDGVNAGNFQYNNNEFLYNTNISHGIRVTPDSYQLSPTAITPLITLDTHPKPSIGYAPNIQPFNTNYFGTDIVESGSVLKSSANSNSVSSNAAAAHVNQLNSYNVQSSNYNRPAGFVDYNAGLPFAAHVNDLNSYNVQSSSYNRPVGFVDYNAVLPLEAPLKTSFDHVQTVLQPTHSFNYNFINSRYANNEIKPGPITLEQAASKTTLTQQNVGLSNGYDYYYGKPIPAYEQTPLVLRAPKVATGFVNLQNRVAQEKQINNIGSISGQNVYVIDKPVENIDLSLSKQHFTSQNIPVSTSFIENNNRYAQTAIQENYNPIVSVTPAVPVFQYSIKENGIQPDYNIKKNIWQPFITSTNILHKDSALSNQLNPTQSIVSVTPAAPVISQIKYVQPESAYEENSFQFNQILQNKPLPVQPIVSVTPSSISSNVDTSQGSTFSQDGLKTVTHIPSEISQFGFQNVIRDDNEFSKVDNYPRPVLPLQEHFVVSTPTSIPESVSINFQGSSTTPAPIQTIGVQNYDITSNLEQGYKEDNVVVITPTESPIVSTTIREGSQVDNIPNVSVSVNQDTEETYENREPVKEEPFVARKTYLTTENERVNNGYIYQKPLVHFDEGSTTPQYQEVSTRTNLHNDYNVDTKTLQKQTAGNILEDYYYSNPKNVYLTTPAPFSRNSIPVGVINNVQPLGQFHFSDSRLHSASSSSSKTEENSQNYEIVVTPRQDYVAPKTITEEHIVSRKPKTYIKVNDFHPLLPAKLGAQCTCTTQSLPLGQSENDESVDENDGYYVKPNSNKAQVDNYSYAPTLSNVQFITSDTVVSTSTPVITVNEQVDPTLSPIIVEDSNDLKEQEIQQTVGHDASGQAAYDRFGHGGVRSRDETLQGVVDCKRAGLFRHPEHCNKFYACRWDTTKNRFTLHIFDCPVYLTFDNNLGACNWPSQGPACSGNTLLPNEIH